MTDDELIKKVETFGEALEIMLKNIENKEYEVKFENEKDNELVKEIKNNIKKFYLREYGEYEEKDLKKYKISLAYTTTEDEKYEIEVSLNLDKQQIINEIYNEIGRNVYSIEQYTLEDLVDITRYMSFDELVNFIDYDEIEDFFKERICSYQHIIAYNDEELYIIEAIHVYLAYSQAHEIIIYSDEYNLEQVLEKAKYILKNGYDTEELKKVLKNGKYWGDGFDY